MTSKVQRRRLYRFAWLPHTSLVEGKGIWLQHYVAIQERIEGMWVTVKEREPNVKDIEDFGLDGLGLPAYTVIDELE